MERNRDFKNEIKIFKMESRFSELILDFQNDIEILNVISVWSFSAPVQI